MPQTQAINPAIISVPIIEKSEKQSLLQTICARIKRFVLAIWNTIRSWCCCNKEVSLLSRVIKSTPLFNKYGFKSDPNVHLTDLDVRPCNLFYEALFGKKFTVTQPGTTPFLKFKQPLKEVRGYLLSLPDDTLIQFSAAGRKANLYKEKQFAKEVNLETYFGKNTYQISAKEIKEMLSSQRIHLSSLIPKAFFLGFKAVLDSASLDCLPGGDGNPWTMAKCAEFYPPLALFLSQVAADPSKFGFDSSTFSFAQVLNLSAYQFGSLVVKTEDYHCLINPNYAIADRKAGQNDAIMLISACGIRGFTASTKLTGNDKHQIDSLILKNTFQTILTSAGKDAFLLMPALGMGVWGGDPYIYWRAFLDAVVQSGSDLQHILVNPGHQPTPGTGYKGEEFAKILDDYKRLNPNNANLNKITNLIDKKTDLLALAQNIKNAHPNQTVALVNASDPDVTLGVVGPGEYANDICHASTTEENFAVAGATLGFEGITGVLTDKNRVM